MLANGLRVPSIMTWKAQWKELEAAGHMMPSVWSYDALSQKAKKDKCL